MSWKTYTEGTPSHWESLRIREREQSLVKKWAPLFIEEGLTRRWTTIGTNGVIYISPESRESPAARISLF